jgi:hypothetical protein
MKKTLEKLANAGKTIGKSIRENAKIGLTALALASPLVSANKAEASEGSILVEYFIGVPYTNSNWALTHASYAEEGLDDSDSLHFPMYNSSGVASKITSLVEGKEADTDQRPENSTSSATFLYRVITHDGSPVPEINNPCLNISTNGFSEEDVSITVEGVTYDAKTVGAIPLTSLSGSGTVSFKSTSEEEPNEPVEPNEADASGMLRIDNVHDKLGATTFELVYNDEGTEEPNDSGDVEYTRWTGVPPPFIVSRVQNKYLKADERGANSKTPLYLSQMFHSDFGFARLGTGDTNALVFSFPDDPDKPANGRFGERVITFQEYIPDVNNPEVADPNAETYPVYLIRDMIEQDPNKMGVILLDDLQGKIYAGTWHNWVLRTDAPSREVAVADFDGNRIVDSNDFSLLEESLGYSGNSRYDIAELKNPAAEPNNPDHGHYIFGQGGDKRVDDLDVVAFYNLMEADEKRRGVYDPNVLEE